MITIVKDIINNYTPKNDFIKVEDLKTYFLARKKFYKNLEEGKDFEIVIKNGKYMNFFIDFEEYQNTKVVLINEISLEQESIELEDNDIFSILFYLKLNKNINKKVILEKYLLDFPEWIKERFLKEEIDNFIQYLINGQIFSKYKIHNFYNLMNETGSEVYNFFKENKDLKTSFDKNIEKLPVYLFKSNELLKENRLKLDVFSEFKITKYLSEISGLLEYEKRFFLDNFSREVNVNRDFSALNEILLKYSKTFNENIDDLKEILNNFKEVLDYEKIKNNDINDWKEFFKEKYIKINGFFYLETFEEKIKKIEKKYNISLDDLKLVSENIFFRINNKFGEFFLKNYSYLNSSEYKKNLEYSIIKNKDKLMENKKQLIIFIDCLRYDVWLKLKEYFIEKGFYPQGEDLIISAIPSVTSYCKRILYSGKKYDMIGLKNNLENLQDIFFDKNLIKLTDDEETLEQLRSEDGIFLYETLVLDKLFHEVQNVTKNYVVDNSLIDFSLKKIIDNLDPNEFNIMVMTDHGTKKLTKKENFSLKNDLNKLGLSTEVQGRSIRIFGENFDKDLYLKVKEKIENEKNYYMISREEFPKYYLPVTEKLKENYFVLLNKDSIGPTFSGDYTHGGISLEEIMIPFCVLSNKKQTYEEIKISVLKNKIVPRKIDDVEILLENRNEIKNLKVSLKTYKMYQVREVFSENCNTNKKILIPLKITDNLMNILHDELIVTFEFDNKLLEKKFDIVIEIQGEDIKSTLNKKLKNSRTLL